ncbi:MAG: amidohydrolase family protein [Gammaproteobacteria bacterium]|nr:amidohydrolase family protein [Gammaproteobacteria bacterium]
MPAARAEGPVALKHERPAVEKLWRGRVQSFLDRGVTPLVDLESSLPRREGENYLSAAMDEMDRLGVALIAFDGYQAPKTGDDEGGGYRWGYYIHEIVNAHPDRFILATNGGTNPNWLKQGDDFIAQVEKHVRGGRYPIMGEFDFRHYLSSHQCRAGRADRDNDIPLNGPNGHRLFRLSQEIGVAFVIHLEPEDAPLAALEEMLRVYPKAKVIVAHFGQIRHPEKEKQFGPALVRRLLTTYPNLHYDISTGHPGRRYACNANVLDTALWQSSGMSQTDTLRSEYKAILSEFSTRFVVGTDYGGGRPPLPEFLRQRVANIRLILRDLPEPAKHDIGYRNAWRLLTGKPWQ